MKLKGKSLNILLGCLLIPGIALGAVGLAFATTIYGIVMACSSLAIIASTSFVFFKKILFERQSKEQNYFEPKPTHSQPNVARSKSAPKASLVNKQDNHAEKLGQLLQRLIDSKQIRHFPDGHSYTDQEYTRLSGGGISLKSNPENVYDINDCPHNTALSLFKENLIWQTVATQKNLNQIISNSTLSREIARSLLNQAVNNNFKKISMQLFPTVKYDAGSLVLNRDIEKLWDNWSTQKTERYGRPDRTMKELLDCLRNLTFDSNKQPKSQPASRVASLACSQGK